MAEKQISYDRLFANGDRQRWKFGPNGNNRGGIELDVTIEGERVRVHSKNDTVFVQQGQNLVLRGGSIFSESSDPAISRTEPDMVLSPREDDGARVVLGANDGKWLPGVKFRPIGSGLTLPSSKVVSPDFILNWAMFRPENALSGLYELHVETNPHEHRPEVTSVIYEVYLPEPSDKGDVRIGHYRAGLNLEMYRVKGGGYQAAPFLFNSLTAVLYPNQVPGYSTDFAEWARQLTIQFLFTIKERRLRYLLRQERHI